MQIKTLSIFLSTLFIITACNSQQQPSTTKENLVVIFAHPDDETTVAPVLTKYSETYQVYLIIATDGRYGVTDHANIPAGDSLVSIRSLELECSCRAMNINPPIQLGILDGMGGDIGMGPYHEQLALLKTRLKNVIDSLSPEIIITYGPDGDTGHPDHRMIGAVTTEIVLHQSWEEMPRLYYFGWTPELAALYTGWNLNYTDPSHLNTVIPYSVKDEEAHYNSIRCYKSQYSDSEMGNWIKTEESNTTNQLYFRSYKAPHQKRSKF